MQPENGASSSEYDGQDRESGDVEERVGTHGVGRDHAENRDTAQPV